MTTVTITLTDNEEDDSVESTMDIVGQDITEPVELTTAVIFGETIMRALPDDGFWQLARGMVPEAFMEESEKVVDTKIN